MQWFAFISTLHISSVLSGNGDESSVGNIVTDAKGNLLQKKFAFSIYYISYNKKVHLDPLHLLKFSVTLSVYRDFYFPACLMAGSAKSSYFKRVSLITSFWCDGFLAGRKGHALHNMEFRVKNFRSNYTAGKSKTTHRTSLFVIQSFMQNATIRWPN